MATNQAPHSEYFFEFGDDAGEAQFILWHHLRHHTYDLINSKLGQTLPPLDLKGDVDRDWLHRHSVRHHTLRKLTGLVSGNSAIGLNRVDWDSKTQVGDWLRIHAVDHANFDAFYRLP
jgi:hypothetical protein